MQRLKVLVHTLILNQDALLLMQQLDGQRLMIVPSLRYRRLYRGRRVRTRMASRARVWLSELHNQMATTSHHAEFQGTKRAGYGFRGLVQGCDRQVRRHRMEQRATYVDRQ